MTAVGFQDIFWGIFCLCFLFFLFAMLADGWTPDWVLGLVIAFAVCWVIFVSIGVIQSVQENRSNISKRNNARSQIARRYGPITIDSLSVKHKTITYKKDGQICKTGLIISGHDYLIVTTGAQCATLPK